MKTRPKELSALALLYLANAIFLTAYPFLVSARKNSAPLWLEGLIIVLAWTLVPLTLRASRALWPISLLLLGSFFIQELPLHSVLLIFPVSLILIALLSPSGRIALFHPARRWWLTPTRKRASLSARLRPVIGGEMLAEIFDISEGGAFIPLGASNRWLPLGFYLGRKPKQKSESPLEIGTYCWIRITLNDLSALTCTAEIVRKTNGRGSYPAGIGLRFVGLSAQDKKELAKFLAS